MGKYDAIKEECCAANIDLSKRGLVDLTFGNVSVCDHSLAAFAIKPSGVDYGVLTPGDMVVVDFEGKVVEGTLRPSSDTPTHRRLYLSFDAACSIVHTHSRSAVAFAQAGRGIPCLGTTHADYFHGEVPVTRWLTPEEIAADYEWHTGDLIIERFATLDHAAIPAVLVRGHGPFTWGPNAAKAVETAFALEICAEMARNTLALAPATNAIPCDLLDKHYLRKHGSSAYYGQR